MKIEPRSPKIIVVECGELQLCLEHINFQNQDVVHLLIRGKEVVIHSHYGDQAPIKHENHLVIKKPREKQP